MPPRGRPFQFRGFTLPPTTTTTTTTAATTTTTTSWIPPSNENATFEWYWSLFFIGLGMLLYKYKGHILHYLSFVLYYAGAGLVIVARYIDQLRWRGGPAPYIRL